MNSIQLLQQLFVDFLIQKFGLAPHKAVLCGLQINTDEQKQAFGDLCTNAAMMLAKELKRSPQAIAQDIIATFRHPLITRIEMAGPGFINVILEPSVWALIVREFLAREKEAFKPVSIVAERINIEFVSANPTGPLHIGHGRGGIIGDVLSRILHFLGHTVEKEFYINDAGAQITKLGNSFKLRCRQFLGESIELPEDAYHGEYLIALARTCIEQQGASVLNEPDQFFERYAQDHMLAAIKQTLALYGITYDVWFSEKSLHDNGAIEEALARLAANDMVYTQDGAVWFKSTLFGDDKDRVVRKSDGTLTYIAADIAYFLNKIERGNQRLIFVLGHDHHSYAVRLDAVRQGLGLTNSALNIILYQLVQIKVGTVPVRMSKRAGNTVNLRELIDTVGVDVARFFYLQRKADAQLEFDLELALKHTDENPVYYLQYAYVRTNSILDKAAQDPLFVDFTTADCALLGLPEALLLKKIVILGTLLGQIGQNYQSHLLANYSIELANVFHAYYSNNRVMDTTNPTLSKDRLQLIKLLNITFKMVFELLGVSAPQRM
jgi:arginyl-tRNA synthetase